MSYRSQLPVLVATWALVFGCGDTAPPEPPSPAPQPPPLPHRLFPDATSALDHVIARTSPRVIGFGEFHQQEGTRAVRSTLDRFAVDLLPRLAPRTSDLVVEAWVSEGKCGATEQAVVAEVEQVSKRPAATEDENLSLLKTAKQLGVRPHILEMSCADYQRVVGGEAGLDYFAMLELVGQRLEQKGRAVLDQRAAQSREGLIAMFGGAIHNDLVPEEDFASFSFGPGIDRAAAGRYVEVDLLVPEYVAASSSAREEHWYPQFARLVTGDRVVLIERGPRSFIIGFPTTAATEQAAAVER